MTIKINFQKYTNFSLQLQAFKFLVYVRILFVVFSFPQGCQLVNRRPYSTMLKITININFPANNNVLQHGNKIIIVYECIHLRIL